MNTKNDEEEKGSDDTSKAQGELFPESEEKVSIKKMLGQTMQEMFLATLDDEDSKNMIFSKIIREIITRADFQKYTASRFYDALKETKVGILEEVTSIICKDLVNNDYEILREEVKNKLDSTEDLRHHIFIIASTYFQKEKEDMLKSLLSERKKMMKDVMPNFVKIKKPNSQKIELELTHEIFKTVLEILPFGNVMLIGPSGSGKTHLAGQIARAMGLQFYFNGAISSEYKLSGFVDANSRYVTTPFRQAYQNGGVYLFDEIDGSSPQALLSFNAALANGQADFPDGQIKRHKDFYCIAAANTYGRGADRLYVGRNQLDASSLDRFIIKEMDYDETLERALAQSDEWVDLVQNWRKSCRKLDVRHIISSRAVIIGAEMLKAGFDKSMIADLVVWKGLPGDVVYKIKKDSPIKGEGEDDLPF